EHGHAVELEKGAERVDVVAARQLEGIVMEADVALAVLALPALRIGLRDPEQSLAVAPARHVGIVVLELEAEEAEQLAIEFLRAREIADAEPEVIDADDARHRLPPARPPAAAHAGAAHGGARAGTIGLGFLVGAGTHLVERGLARRTLGARPQRRDLVA